MSKILVTGGAGFIGSHLCDRLLKDGHTVICLDHLSDYYDPKIKINNIYHNFSNPNFIFLVKNVVEKDKMEKIIQKYEPEIIIHLAASAGVRSSLEEPMLFRDTNVVGTVNLLELSKEYNIKNFIFASSSSVYGNNEKVPFNEEDLVDWPISPYATSKRACELYCYNYHYICGLNTTILRFFNAFGPRNRPDMAHFTFTKAISQGTTIKKFGDGSTSRDYTFIEDIIDGIVKAMNKPLGFEIINLGNSHPITLNTMIATLEAAIGKKAVIQEMPTQLGDVEHTFADIGKAKKILDWEPKTPYAEGVKKLVEWYKQNYN